MAGQAYILILYIHMCEYAYISTKDKSPSFSISTQETRTLNADGTKFASFTVYEHPSKSKRIYKFAPSINFSIALPLP